MYKCFPKVLGARSRDVVLKLGHPPPPPPERLQTAARSL